MAGATTQIRAQRVCGCCQIIPVKAISLDSRTQGLREVPAEMNSLFKPFLSPLADPTLP